MRLRPANFTCLALMSLPLLGCNQLEAIQDSGSGGGGGVPPAVRAAFEESCGKTGCHGEGGPTTPPLAGQGLDGVLTGQGAGGPLVTLGDTANSYIAIKMLPDAVVADLGATRTGSRMPLDGDYLNPNNQTILAWIAGAEFEGGDTTDGGGSSGGSASDPTMGSSGGPVDATFGAVQAIFDAKCSCHIAPPNPVANGGMELTAGVAYANIVGVKSSEATTTNRIEPGDPSASYLYLKLTMAFNTVPGGVPDPMPLGPPLPAGELATIEQWILDGALNN